MNLVEALVTWCAAHPWRTVIAVAVAALIALEGSSRLTFDAFPDLTNVQVQVLTTAPGLGAEEVERLVTAPVERAVSGLPGAVSSRSVSRPGVSAVAVVFADGTDPWAARLQVSERVATARAEIPPEAGNPELAPPTTGLGEVFQFVVTSDRHSVPDLYRIVERDMAPRLRTIPGVVEVNPWASGPPQVEVRLDPYALAARGLSLPDVRDAVAAGLGAASGGTAGRGREREAISGFTAPGDVRALGDLPLPDGGRLAEVADVSWGAATPVGFGTARGEQEAVFAVVQLLAGADARAVVREVDARVEAFRPSLPEGVRVEVVYDRDRLVGGALHTVERSLLEGGLLVIGVLLLMLGDLRAGLLVASVIPLSLLGALFALQRLGYSGNLMSLGAIDFGLVVDGTVVVVEGIAAGHLVGERSEAVAERTRALVRPVLTSVVILGLAYVPVLAMTGTEGRLFRPMALTVLFALGTAVVLTFTFVPAVAARLLPETEHHDTALVRGMRRIYAPLLDALLRHPTATMTVGLGGGLVSLAVFATLGIEFVPRLEEGDLVVQAARPPSVSAAEALRQSLQVERVLRTFPEVEMIGSRTGSPTLATDPMGIEESDVLVRLRPKETWTTAADLDGLIAAMAKHLDAEAPGASYGFTQPIEMRFNELLEGVTADVGVEIYGPDLDVLQQLGEDVAAALRGVPGAADVRAPALDGLPGTTVALDPGALARHGLRAEDALTAIESVDRGVTAGEVLRGPWREAVVLRLAPTPDVAWADRVVPGGAAGFATYADLGEVRATLRPAAIRRQDGSRRVVVQANARGRDLGGFVADATAAVDRIALPPGYWIAWSGQYEQLRAASARTAVTVPLMLAAIAVLLRLHFSAWKPAILVLLAVPVATSGGGVALLLRGLPLSMSAIVGFVALSGLAVMNGVVLVTRTRELHPRLGALEAARVGALERLRPVLMTAGVAGIGFLPMALATGVGAEVQRPLATVVIGGLLTATPLTLGLLPTLYARHFRSEDPRLAGVPEAASRPPLGAGPLEPEAHPA